MSERGIIERTGDGAIPGLFVGFTLGASRAYLQSRELAEKSAAATAAAMHAKIPPTEAALRALRPNVRSIISFLSVYSYTLLRLTAAFLLRFARLVRPPHSCRLSRF